MYLERNLFLLSALLLNAFIVEPTNDEFHSATVNTKVTRRDLLVQRNDSEHRRRNNNSTVTITCQRNNKIMISGSLLKLSEIPPKPDRKCDGTEANIIELFATEKVIIDEDFIESGEQLTFIIIAPTWEVIGNRNIVLDGSPGTEHHQPKAKNDSALSGYDGANGKPGVAGGRGGNFYGIGKTFINGDKLLISANGGNGGSGQDGGDGADGIDAPTYQFEESLAGLEDPQYIVESTLNYFDPFGTITTHYIVHGQNGTVGGKGGDGGCGGRGGNQGQIIILNLNGTGNTFISASVSDGFVGQGGDGGKGGKGGSNARSVKFTHQNIHSSSYFSHREEIDNGYARDGENGMANENLLGLSLLNDFYPSLNIQSAISDFKFFAMWHLLNSTDDEKFREFYFVLLNDETVENWNTVSGFQVEAFYLEKFHTYSKNRDLLLPFVKSLKQRIRAFLEDRKEFTHFNENINILEIVLLRFRDVDHFQPVAPDFVNLFDIGSEMPDINDAVLKFDYFGKLDQRMKLVKNYFLKISSMLSEEIEGEIDEFKRVSDEKIERLMMESSSSMKHIIQRWVKLNIEFTIRFALENFRFLNLALQFTNIKVFVSSMLKLNNETESGLFANTDFAQFIYPRNVQETYQEIQIKYKNYINKRVGIIRSHQAFVKEQTRLASDEEVKALDRLSRLLEELCVELKSSNFVRTDPFLMQEDILSQEERFLNVLSKGSINYSFVIQVIEHLKLHSLLGEIFGDSYERFANNNLADEIGKISFNFRNTDVYSKLINMRNTLSTIILSEFDINWITNGMANDKIEATKEIDFNEVKSHFYSYFLHSKKFILAINYLKEMQSQ